MLVNVNEGNDKEIAVLRAPNVRTGGKINGKLCDCREGQDGFSDYRAEGETGRACQAGEETGLEEIGEKALPGLRLPELVFQGVYFLHPLQFILA